MCIQIRSRIFFEWCWTPNLIDRQFCRRFLHLDAIFKTFALKNASREQVSLRVGSISDMLGQRDARINGLSKRQTLHASIHCASDKRSCKLIDSFRTLIPRRYDQEILTWAAIMNWFAYRIYIISIRLLCMDCICSGFSKG